MKKIIVAAVLVAASALADDAGQSFLEDFATWPASDVASGSWQEDFDVSGGLPPDSPYHPDMPFGLNQRTPNGWWADNGMFVCDVFTNAEEGLSLQLEGGGLGAVALRDLPADDMLHGIGTIDFSARVVQRPSLEGFAWASQTDALAGNPASTLALTNYGFSVKAEMSTMRGKSEFPVLDHGDIRYDSGGEGGRV